MNVEQIQNQLASQDEENRIAAIRAAREQDLSLPMSLLAIALGDASWRVRKEAVNCFLQGAHRRWSAEDAIALLHSEDNAGLRNAAMEVLIGMGSSAVGALKGALTTADQDVRKFILDIFGEIGDEVCVGTLIEALTDPDMNVRSAAVENLGKLQAPEAIGPLLETLSTPDFSWRFTILEALAQIGKPVPLEKLAPLGKDRLLRKALFDCFGAVGDLDAIPLLVEGLSDDMRKCREAAALSLVRLADRYADEVLGCLRRHQPDVLTECLAGLLRNRDRSVQESAIRLLGMIGNSAAAGSLCPLLADEVFGPCVLDALMGMGKEAIDGLVREHFGQDPEMDVYLVYLAGEMQCHGLAHRVAGGLDAENSQMRLVTARTLAKIGGPEAVDPLLLTLDDEVEEVREAAAAALAVIGRRAPRDVLDRVAPMVESARANVRTSAVDVLGQIGDASCRPYLDMAFKDESPTVRQAAVRALAECGGDDLTSGLKLALTDEDAEVRALAAENLGLLGGDEAVESLGFALKDEDLWVRAKAVRSLCRIGDERAFALIEQVVHDPVGLVAIAALETLAEVNPARARAALFRALDHPDEEVVKAALQGLGNLAAGDWVCEVAHKMVDHPQWGVRLTLVNLLGSFLTDELRALLEKRLCIEGDELVRQAIEDLLSAGAQGGH